jgi:hypothetical protein
MTNQLLPDTRRGRSYRKLLEIAYVASIAGITLTLRDLIAALLNARFNPGGLPAELLAFSGVLLVGWGLVGWMAYRGSRRGLAPPTWSYAVVVGLSWAAILLNRLG